MLFHRLAVRARGTCLRRRHESGHPKGLWLTTDYPSVTARAGETTTIKMKLQNYDLPPERVALSVDGAPQGWNAVILGGSTPVTAAMPATNDNVAAVAARRRPGRRAGGTQTVTSMPKRPMAAPALPIDISAGQDLPAQLTIKAKLPSLNGTATTSFEFQFTVTNQSDKDLLVKLAAEAPQGFQTSFMEAYGTQELSSIPIEAGKDKDFKVKVTPPANVTAGDYPVAVQVRPKAPRPSPDDDEISGQPKLKLTRRGRPPLARPRPASHADQAHREQQRQRARQRHRAERLAAVRLEGRCSSPTRSRSSRPTRSATSRRC